MKTNAQNLVLAGVSLLTVGIIGCSTPDRSSGWVYDDWRTTRKVQSALGDAPVYKFKDVHVDTFRGAVQLNGWVNIEDQKFQAEEITRRVPGVQKVFNNIAFKPDGVIVIPSTTGRATEARVAQPYPPQ